MGIQRFRGINSTIHSMEIPCFSTQPGRNFVVVGKQCAALSSGDDLRSRKREAGNRTNPADMAMIIKRAQRLCGILNKRNAGFLRERLEGIDARARSTPVSRYHHEGLGTRSNSGTRQSNVHH